MEVYLLRHGVAEDAEPPMQDADRALTPEGRKKLALVLEVAQDSGVRPDLILSSEVKRAWQTATIARKLLNPEAKLEKHEALLPGARASLPWQAIRAHRDVESLLLAGHNPQFGRLAAYLLGTPGAQIDFKKGALMRIDFRTLTPDPKGVLRWYLTPRLASR
jgi:phosphohistidine phosphatase